MIPPNQTKEVEMKELMYTAVAAVLTFFAVASFGGFLETIRS